MHRTPDNTTRTVLGHVTVTTRVSSCRIIVVASALLGPAYHTLLYALPDTLLVNLSLLAVQCCHNCRCYVALVTTV